MFIARNLIRSLTKLKIINRQQLKYSGPVIYAGNHTASLEVVMMCAFAPRMVEFVGAGDVPFEPNFKLIVESYGIIPVNRGNVDRSALHAALEVLNQGGVIGIFPEGGIWEPTNMRAQTGIAWLSWKAQAPVIPIGFSGTYGVLGKIFGFKFPEVGMKVGNLIPPLQMAESNLSVKAALQQYADRVLAEIKSLLPQEEFKPHSQENAQFNLEIEVLNGEQRVEIPEALQVQNWRAYSELLFTPFLLNILALNLRLPVRPLKLITHKRKLKPVLTALKSILDYLETNPGLFIIRMGIEQGTAVRLALEEMQRLITWVQDHGYTIRVTPIRRRFDPEKQAWQVEEGGNFPKSM